MACLGHRSHIGPQLWGRWLYLGLARHLRQLPAALYTDVSAGWIWLWCQPKEWDPASSTLAIQEQVPVWGMAQVIPLFLRCSYELEITMNEVNECLTIIHRKKYITSSLSVSTIEMSGPSTQLTKPIWPLCTPLTTLTKFPTSMDFRILYHSKITLRCALIQCCRCSPGFLCTASGPLCWDCSHWTHTRHEPACQ